MVSPYRRKLRRNPQQNTNARKNARVKPRAAIIRL
jgi:hypothetical protein